MYPRCQILCFPISVEVRLVVQLNPRKNALGKCRSCSISPKIVNQAENKSFRSILFYSSFSSLLSLTGNLDLVAQLAK